ncbi:MAG: YadA-like family protein [Phascolarctobacterium sp.]|nr:YadA-like family protein [Phascolarctobacterium sp.]
MKLSKDVTGLNSVTATTINSETVNVSKEININNKVKITENGMNINNKVVVEENNINVGGNTINNVAAGEISQNSTQAINGSQLYATNQRIEKLSGRVDKVGAGAAALAALHPMDFDPDDKLSFSAGVGNYGGETATALGMFYRPTEKVMLSAAGTMGNGENMVNMGVTFALDKTNNVSNSRVAMAREIQDLREQVAALTALVTQLAGRSNPALQDVVMFPYVPENHWSYDYIEGLQKRGIVEGYPDGNFAGDRSMTRYEYAAMLYRALEKGFPVDSRLLDEFDAELGRIRVDRIKGLDDDANKVERVRVNQYEDRDDYGSKLIAVNAVKQ